jgi:hypothetical protein
MFNFYRYRSINVAMITGAVRNPTGKSMPTDPTEDRKSDKACLACDGGFTQTWDTVGAGIAVPRQRELSKGERIALQ